MNPFAPLHAYCERHSDSLWAEPFNTFSCLAFLVSGLYILALWRAYRASWRTTEPAWLALSVTLIGLTGIVYHMVAVPVSALLKIICVALFLHLYTRQLLEHTFTMRQGPVMTLVVAILSVVLSATLLIDSSLLIASQAYFASVAAFAALVFALYHQQQPKRHLAAWAFGFYLLALFFRLQDKRWCELFPHGTYFFWHLFNAVVIALLARFLILNRAVRF